MSIVARRRAGRPGMAKEAKRQARAERTETGQPLTDLLSIRSALACRFASLLWVTGAGAGGRRSRTLARADAGHLDVHRPGHLGVDLDRVPRRVAADVARLVHRLHAYVELVRQPRQRIFRHLIR